MSDRSKLPMHRIDGLNNQLNEINSNIITINNTKLPFIILSANTDFNTLIETGLYYIHTDIGNIDTVHYPVDNNSTVWFVTVHMQKSSTTKMAVWQYAHAQNSFNSKNNGTKIYARTYNSYNESETGVWTEWFQITGSGLDLPSNKIINNVFNSSVTTTQQTYTAPANGYIKLTSADSTPVDLAITSIGHMGTVGASIGANKAIIIPISKGQQAFIKTVSNSATLATSMFIYANSEVSTNEQ